jgi:acetylglutamate kinase
VICPMITLKSMLHTEREEEHEVKYIVIKCGGSVLDTLPLSFYQNVVALHQEGNYTPIIVHGGGPVISSLLTKHGVETIFVQGLRVTTEEVLDVVEMALSGVVNKKIVRQLRQINGEAYGISGIDGRLLTAKRVKREIDLGYVGEVTHVNREIIDKIAEQVHIPVVSPLGLDANGQRYNINADMAAASIAQALGASLCFISDIPGIYMIDNGQKKILHHLTQSDIYKLIEEKVIQGGMIPKVTSAIAALSDHVPEVAIIDGVEKDSLLRLLKGEKVGTKITLEKEASHVK